MTLNRLLEPRGIAVVGASPEASRPGYQAIRALLDNGYGGGIHPVNPKYESILGLRCCRSLAEVVDACDVAVISLPAPAVPDQLGACGAAGIPFAVVQGGGFREAGEEGAALERAALAAARAGNVRFLGPNCLGYVNLHTRAYAAFGSLTRPPQLRPGPVSVVLQSASFGMSIVVQCDAGGVGFRHVVTSGNEADITTPELIDAYVDDPGTKAILAYIEGVRDGRAFMAAALRAAAAGKPLIVMKAGNTEQGRRAAESHTANLTADYDVYRAAFRQCGVIEVADVQDAVDMTLAFAGGRRAPGRRVAVIGGSGGAAALFSDQADAVGLKLAPLSEETLAVLRANLPRLSSLRNPVDYTAGYPRAGAGLNFERAFRALADDPGVDQVGFLFAAAGRAQLEHGGKVLRQVAAQTGKPLLVFSGMTEALASEGLAELRAAGLPVLPSPRRVASAMGALARHAEYRPPRVRAPEVIALPPLPAAGGALDEIASKAIVASAGIAVTADRCLPLQPSDADGVGLAYPVALKVRSRDIAHKTDVGGVRLGIKTPAALRTAAASLIDALRSRCPEARLDGLIASPMIAVGAETLVGVVNDRAFGPVVAVGLGGIYTEVLDDVAYRVAPFGVDDARAMIAELRGAALLAGVRGSAPLDLEALARALVRLGDLAWQLRDRLEEMDVNPLFVLPAGHGVMAADALVVLREASA